MEMEYMTEETPKSKTATQIFQQNSYPLPKDPSKMFRALVHWTAFESGISRADQEVDDVGRMAFGHD
eukprot:1779823-Amphidinium_carterae.2